MRAELAGARVHADVRIDQHVRGILRNLLAPALDWQRALDEAVAQLARRLGLAVLRRRRVIAEHLELFAIELRKAPLDQELPDRVTAKQPGDNADSHPLARSRRRRELCVRIAFGHRAAHQRSVHALQFAVVVALIGQMDRLARCNSCRKIALDAAMVEIATQSRQTLLIPCAALGDFSHVVVENR